ncbi:hypothetical protein ACFU8I_02790 [Streptomyces sp. NPDC057540]|uniref:hypothetical protein n=1 Tax=Streptomyces sp. NPDC057540 TaxID=3346160 RepID=UPI0036AAF49D
MHQPLTGPVAERMSEPNYFRPLEPKYVLTNTHPHDVLAYRADAHAVMAAVVRPLLDRARRAEAAVERARAALDSTA